MKSYIKKICLSVICLSAFGYINSAHADCGAVTTKVACNTTSGCFWGYNNDHSAVPASGGTCSPKNPCSCLTK
jgi:hypothetical protein